MNKELLKLTLMNQRETILNRDFGIRREVIKDIERKIKLPHVLVLTGLRRSGKSTVLRQIASLFYKDDDFYYVNFEDERLLGFKAENFSQIHETLIDLFGEKKNFLIDEIQNVSKFETFVRRMQDQGYKFIITGSNSKLLSKELGTKLTGRHVDITIRPFSFAEYLTMNGIVFRKKMQYQIKGRAQLKKAFRRYLLNGGMPEYSRYKDPEMLTRVYEDIVLKDIVARFNLDNTQVIRELYLFLITNFGRKFSYNSLTKFSDIKSSNTVRKYINYLEQTYFIKTVTKFDYSLKKQIVNDKKIYIVDNGFIQFISTKTTKDNGWLLENLAFNLFSEGENVYYFEDKKTECDFVILGKHKMAVQVCFELEQQNREREILGLSNAMKALRIKKGLVLTNDQEETINLNDSKIAVKPLWKFMLEKPS